MKPIYLIFNATHRCNSSCSTCFAWKYLNKNIEKELKLWEIKKISNSLNRIVWLLVGGGEPFLRKNLDKIIKIFYNQNKVRRVTISTNAILTKKIKLDVTNILTNCPKLKLVITLSIDGVGKEHDDIRGVPGNFKHLEDTYNMLSKLKKIFPNLSINMNTCLNNKNISRFDKLLNYIKNHFRDINFYGVELLRGTPRDETFKTPPVKEYRAVLEKIENYWKEKEFYNMGFSRILKSAKILARDIEIDILTKGIKTPCKAGSVVGVISAQGDVSLCELLKPVGNIRDYDYNFKAVWANEAASAQRKTIKNGIAKACHGCTHSCFVSSAILFTPSLYPKLLLYTLRGK